MGEIVRLGGEVEDPNAVAAPCPWKTHLAIESDQLGRMKQMMISGNCSKACPVYLPEGCAVKVVAQALTRLAAKTQ